MLYHGGFFGGNEKNKVYPDRNPVWFDCIDVNAMFIAVINGNSNMKLAIILWSFTLTTMRF
jgi:hypothetical protein